jgi:hypothetical protein
MLANIVSNISLSDISNAVTLLLVIIIVALSLKKYIKMSKNGCGCGCADCPSKNNCPSKTEQKIEDDKK